MFAAATATLPMGFPAASRTYHLRSTVSTFAISQLLGGSKDLLLGDLIEMQFLGSAYNPHLGSAIALVMMIIVMICMGLMNKFGDGEEQAVIL